MYKTVIFLIFFLIVLSNIPSEERFVFNEISNSNYYELDFMNDNLNFGNFKLKMAPFTSYEYNIKKIYINDIQKGYLSFDNSNFNIGIEKLKEEYKNILRENYMYNKLDNDINNVRINRVYLYTEQIAISNFSEKYPKVIIKRIEN